MTKQSGVYTQIKDIFKNVPLKETYFCNQNILLPTTQYEINGLSLNAHITCEIVENDLKISIEFISRDSLETAEIKDVDLCLSAWFNHKDKKMKKLLKQTIDEKLIILENILKHCDDTITDFEQYKKFIKNLIYPQVIFHENLLKLFDEETLSKIFAKSRLIPSPKFNPYFFDKKNKNQLFIYDFKGFIHFGKDENSYGVGLDFKEPLPLVYKGFKKLGHISCEDFLQRLGI